MPAFSDNIDDSSSTGLCGEKVLTIDASTTNPTCVKGIDPINSVYSIEYDETLVNPSYIGVP